jgi:isoamylase/glycogen operon protein
MSEPPLIEEMLKEPDFANTKWIAEAWDAAGLYQVGNFPGQGKWGEWNGRYRDVVRKFIKGTDGLAGAFAGALCGSAELYAKDRAPYHSINFITAHDGYSLKDLVSYQDKHNEANGEENRDGANDNESWNCGAEGETANRKILHLRDMQMKNFLLTLFLSVGTPMILMGDEYGHTRKGNNNPYCQDNELNWFLWDELPKNQALHHFCSFLIHFRAKHPHLFCRKKFLTDQDVQWHGHKALQPSWDGTSRFVAYTLLDKEGLDLYIAFNAHFEEASIELPQRKDKKQWYKVIDTALEAPATFSEHPEKGRPEKFSYKMPSHSAIVLQAF